jgi:4-amino-4-deoxy-L-arabinose transferase-like glycosyltransferase
VRWLGRPLLRHRLLLLTLGSIVFLSGLGTPGLYDPNEGLYAEVAWQMYDRGDWLSPRFNGVRYFEKPPLLYWLIAGAYALFGVSDAAARLPTALAGVAGVLITFEIGRTLGTPRAGLLAALALLSSFGYFIFARIVLTDLLFTACLSASLWWFLRGYLEPTRRASYPLAYVFSGLAVLAKGLLGLALPALIVGGLMAATRDWKLARELRLPLGAALVLAVAAPWHLAVGWANEGFFWFYFVNEHLLRFLHQRHLIDYAPLPLWLFLLMALVWSFPWSLVLPFAWRQLLPSDRGARRGLAVAVIPCWIGAVLGFFALTPARLEYYSLPALPAFALWVGRYWDDALALPDGVRALRWPLLSLLGASLALLPLAASFPHLEGVAFYNIFPALDAYARDIQQGILAAPGTYTVPSFRELVLPLVLAAGALLLGSLGAFVAGQTGRGRFAFACLVGMMLAVFPLIHRGLVLFEPHRSVRQLAAELRHVRRPDDPIVVEGPYENFAALNVYTRAPALVLNGRFGDLAFGADHPEVRARFLDDDAFERLWRSSARVYLLTVSTTRVETLRREGRGVILGRTGNKWLLVNRR